MNTNNSHVFYLNWENGGLTDVIYNENPYNYGKYIEYTPQKFYFILEINQQNVKTVPFYGSSIDECKQWVLDAGIAHNKYTCYNRYHFRTWQCLTTPIQVKGIVIDYRMEKCFQQFNTNDYNMVEKLTKVELLPFIIDNVNNNARQAWGTCFESNFLDLLELKSLDKQQLIYFALTCENYKGFNTSLFSLVPDFLFQQKMISVIGQPMLMVIDDTDDMVIHPVLYKDTNDIRTYINYSCMKNQRIHILPFTFKKQFIVIIRHEEFTLCIEHEDDIFNNCEIICGKYIDRDFYIVDLIQFMLPDDTLAKRQSIQYKEQPKIEYKHYLY